MSFYRNDNYREQPISEKKKSRFQVSDKSFQSATIVSSLAITIFVFILFIVKAKLSISESDIQTISGITAGLCSFALAIPLFLKDFDITSNFWRQFYLIAITFLVAAFIGVISFLLIDEKQPLNVVLYLWFFLSIVISVNINTIGLLLNRTNFQFKFSINPIFNLSIAYFALFISLIFSKGNFWIHATVLFSIYGFYLTLTLMLSILIELFFTNSKTENNDIRIKKGIQHLAEKYRYKALTEQILLDKLKSEEFVNEKEIISRTKVKELVLEMDSETADNEPRITIYEHEKIIPRWRKEYDEIFAKTDIIFIRGNYTYGDYGSKQKEKDIDEIYDALSAKINLSNELLKENDCISRYYLLKVKFEYHWDYLFIKENVDNIKEGDTIYLYESDDIVKLNKSVELKDYIGHPISVIWINSLSEIK